MRKVRGPRLLGCIAVALAPGLFAQTIPLNPTVSVLAKPTSAVPPECEQGLAPAAPRPPVEAAAAIAPVATTSAPPASDLRTRLRGVQTAAESGNYDEFKAALAGARTSVAAYPGGGEKQAAADVLQAYADLERLWDYAQTNRTGAFFSADSEGGAIVSSLRKYPGFQRAVADATMTIGDQTIYPSRETERFLTEEAARRLTRIGVRTATRAAATPPPAPKHAAAAERKPAAPPHVRHATSERHATTKKPPANIAEAAPKHERVKRHAEATPATAATTTRHSSGGQAPSAVPVTPLPTTPATPTATETTATPATVSTASAPATATSTTAPPMTAAPTTTSPSTTAPSTAPSQTATAETTSSATERPLPAQGGGMNLTFAIILIVVGVGVLIVLFRASD